MRIHGIEIDNFLSFQEFRWTNVHSDLNIIVGPNGVGKTNVFEAVRAVLDVLSTDPTAYARRAVLRKAVHRADAEKVIRIALDVTLNTEWEQSFLRAFLAAVLAQYSPDAGQFDSLGRLATFWYDSLSELNVSFLLNGRLVVTCDPTGRWSIWYESISPEFPFRWDIEGIAGSPFSATSSENDWQGGLTALLGSYTESDRELLLQHLHGAPQRPPVPDLRRVLDAQNMSLEIIGQSPDARRTHRELARLAGLDSLATSQIYGARFAFHQILQRALVFTDNVRQTPTYKLTVSQLNSPVVDLSSGKQLPLYLFQKKNTGNRKHYQAIESIFHRLTNKHFDIGLSTVRGNERAVSTDDLLLELTLSTRWGNLPLEFSGAGRREALFLSAILAGTQEKVVLFDEPAQNLHPSIQTRLVNEMRNTTFNASQFFVTTHSPALISPDAIDKVSRFYMSDETTLVAALKLRQLSEGNQARLQKELRGSSDARALLFARGVLLVEGDTEFGTLPIWYHNLYGRYLEDDDVVIYSVGSDNNFETYLRFLEGYNVPWVIVCDGAVIGDPTNTTENWRPCRMARQLANACINEMPNLDQYPFQERRDQLERYGVFTGATSSEKGRESFEAVISLARGKNGNRARSKVRRARRFAEDNSCPPVVIALLEKVTMYLTGRIGVE